MTDLITVHSFMDRKDAEIAKGILDENNINSFYIIRRFGGLTVFFH